MKPYDISAKGIEVWGEEEKQPPPQEIFLTI